MAWFFTVLIWLLVLNTTRLLFKELRKRHIEVRDGTTPNMLPNDFVIRDTPRDFCVPFLIMFASTIGLTLGLQNIIEIYLLIMIILALIFFFSWHEATDRITWIVTVENEFMTLRYFNIDFIRAFLNHSTLSKVAHFWLVTSALKEPLSIKDESVTALKHSNGDIEIFKGGKHLFKVETTHTAYELMVAYLISHEKFLLENNVNEADIFVEDVVEEKSISNFERTMGRIVVRKLVLRKMKGLVTVSVIFVMVIVAYVALVLIASRVQVIAYLLINIGVYVGVYLLIPGIFIGLRAFFSLFKSALFRLWVDEQGFEINFGKKAYSFDQVSRVKIALMAQNKKTYSLYDDDQKIIIKLDSSYKNIEEFLLRLFEHNIPLYYSDIRVMTKEELLGKIM